MGIWVMNLDEMVQLLEIQLRYNQTWVNSLYRRLHGTDNPLLVPASSRPADSSRGGQAFAAFFDPMIPALAKILAKRLYQQDPSKPLFTKNDVKRIMGECLERLMINLGEPLAKGAGVKEFGDVGTTIPSPLAEALFFFEVHGSAAYVIGVGWIAHVKGNALDAGMSTNTYLQQPHAVDEVVRKLFTRQEFSERLGRFFGIEDDVYSIPSKNDDYLESQLKSRTEDDGETVRAWCEEQLNRIYEN